MNLDRFISKNIETSSVGKVSSIFNVKNPVSWILTQNLG